MSKRMVIRVFDPGCFYIISETILECSWLDKLILLSGQNKCIPICLKLYSILHEKPRERNISIWARAFRFCNDYPCFRCHILWCLDTLHFQESKFTINTGLYPYPSDLVRNTLEHISECHSNLKGRIIFVDSSRGICDTSGIEVI